MIKNKRFLWLLAAALFSTNLQAQVSRPDDVQVETWMQETNTPSLGIALIEKGDIIHSKVYGAKSSLPDASSRLLFNVASVTKSISTYTTLRMVDQGKWTVEEPLANYWIDPDVAGDPNHQKLNTKHVLTHQTGFKNWRWLTESKKLQFDFEPGTRTQYSGEGFEYLKKALEQKFGKSLNELVSAQVLNFFGMEQSYMVWPDQIDEQYLAGAYNNEGKLYDPDKRTEAMASDDLLTTIDDLATFSLAVMNKKGISEQLYTEMVSAQAPVKPGIAFGYGWLVFDNLPNGEYALANFGSDAGVNAAIVLLPKSKSGLVITTNADGGRAAVMKAIGSLLGEAGQSILSRF